MVQGIADCTGRPHKSLLHVASQYPVLANIHYHFLDRHFLASTGMSVSGLGNRHGCRFSLKIFFEGM
jgi:hypothetical protein